MNGRTNNQSPEDWEASDHIDNLKAQWHRLQKPEALSAVCTEHVAMFNAILPAQIWQIRHADRVEKQGGRDGRDGHDGRDGLNVKIPFLRTFGSPMGVICVLLIFAVVILAVKDSAVVEAWLGKKEAAAVVVTDTDETLMTLKRDAASTIRGTP